MAPELSEHHERDHVLRDVRMFVARSTCGCREDQQCWPCTFSAGLARVDAAAARRTLRRDGRG